MPKVAQMCRTNVYSRLNGLYFRDHRIAYGFCRGIDWLDRSNIPENRGSIMDNTAFHGDKQIRRATHCSIDTLFSITIL
ncbi:hypothetical protein HCUR_00457 [Holospora curviuscula]|uniref:Uncharacterized protein n=1 Tax=Holospora curviuscula TaxID=1082868 RepID=A0A2S5RAA8_9PROT|nr:hypothetical protein HCUR_00457 [Holospora curviuscula]